MSGVDALRDVSKRPDAPDTFPITVDPGVIDVGLLASIVATWSHELGWFLQLDGDVLLEGLEPAVDGWHITTGTQRWFLGFTLDVAVNRVTSIVENARLALRDRKLLEVCRREVPGLDWFEWPIIGHGPVYPEGSEAVWALVPGARLEVRRRVDSAGVASWWAELLPPTPHAVAMTGDPRETLTSALYDASHRCRGHEGWTEGWWTIVGRAFWSFLHDAGVRE